MNRDVLEFVTFCIGSLAIRLNKSRSDVYQKLERTGVLGQYIIPCYNILHTFDEDYIVDELIGVLKKRGELL